MALSLSENIYLHGENTFIKIKCGNANMIATEDVPEYYDQGVSYADRMVVEDQCEKKEGRRPDII